MDRFQSSEEILMGNQNYVVANLLMVIFVSSIILLSCLPLRTLIKCFWIFTVLSSILTTFAYQCLLDQAEYKVTIAEAPEECFKDFDKDGYFMYLWLVFKNFGGDHCKKYHMAILMQRYSFLKTTLLKAVSITFADASYVFLERLGPAFGKFFQSAFSEIPFPLWILAFLFLVIIVIAAALAVALLTYLIITGCLRKLFHRRRNPTPSIQHGDDNWVRPAPAVEHQALRQCQYSANRGNALEYHQFPQTSLGNPDNQEVTYLEVNIRRTICYQERASTMPALAERPRSPQNDDPGQNLSFIEEGLDDMVQCISDWESKELVLNLINSMKEVAKDLRSLGVENFGITYKDVSCKLDHMDACSASLGAHFDSIKSTKSPAIVLTEINDSIQKLRPKIQE